MDTSALQIQRRILLLVLRAFVIVVCITLLLFLTITGIAVARLAQTNPTNQLPLISLLKGYYLGHNGWDGIATLFADSSSKDTTQDAAYLLDAQGLVLIDHGRSNTGLVGRIYPPNSKDLIIELQTNGQKIGTLILDQNTLPSKTNILINTLFPIGLASLSLALLTTLLGLQLIRRIVTPLANVIAAAQAVTAGKLDARVEVEGPQDLIVLTDSFNQMASSLEKNDKERRDLLADIAHELRTPIMAVRGRLESMLDGVYAANEHQLNQVLKANYLLERLVEDLRILTLAEARQLDFEKRETNLIALATHVLEMFSAEAKEKKISLSLEPTSGDYSIIADPQRVEQVIGNLVGNALHYVPEGGKVRITLEQAAGNVNISINDNGPGVPAEDLPYIFNRFWRKDKSRTRQSGGSGLGLAIAKQFIEAQGGRISAENLPEGGLKMQVIFPNDRA